MRDEREESSREDGEEEEGYWVEEETIRCK